MLPTTSPGWVTAQRRCGVVQGALCWNIDDWYYLGTCKLRHIISLGPTVLVCAARCTTKILSCTVSTEVYKVDTAIFLIFFLLVGDI